MKSKTNQLKKSQTAMTRHSNSTCDSRQQESALSPRCSQVDIRHGEVEIALNTSQKNSVREKSSKGPSSNPWSSLDIPCKQYSEDSDDLVKALFDGTWRSAVSSVSDDFERKVSSESFESEVSSTAMEASSSLDDVFEELFDGVLDEMDTFGSGQGGIASLWPTQLVTSAPFGTPMPVNGPYTTPLMHQIDENPQYKTNSLFQRPSNVPCHSFNPFQAFNFGLVKGLENPSRGLITVIRRLCDLLSKPRSDHLDSVFVRLLNNALKEMEDAAHPTQQKRPRKKAERRHDISKRQKITVISNSVSDRKACSSSDISDGLSLSSECQSVKSKGSENNPVDLTVLADRDNEKDSYQRQQHRHVVRDESFIALEDTVSDFMSSLLH